MQQANRHLLRELGWRQIPPRKLERITGPTVLLWGRQDRVMPLPTAQQASPLRLAAAVIETPTTS